MIPSSEQPLPASLAGSAPPGGTNPPGPSYPRNLGIGSGGDRQNYTLAEILADDQLKSELVTMSIRRFLASANYMVTYHDKWLRFYKLYRNIVDVVEDEDEPNTGVVYAFAIIENLVSKIAEPLLGLRPPCRVAPRLAGQEGQAERFEAMAGSYFRTSRYGLDYTNSIREEVIVGNAWENDCWFNEYERGRRWKKVVKTGVTFLKNMFGRLTGQKDSFSYDAPEEVPHDYPVRVGYGTKFPSVFRMYPEPHVYNVRDMHWLIEEVPSAAIVDLERQMRVDPATGEKVPFFNFTELRDAYTGNQGEIRPEPLSRQRASAEDELRQVTGDQPERDRQLTYADDIDRVSLIWVWERDRVFVIAQGRFLVAYLEKPFQVPRIPYRLRCYTPQKDFLFGIGAIEPVENQINELTDIHKMSMRNWVRIINRMIAYQEESVPYEDDFTPSALGRVRVRVPPGKSIGDVMMPIHHDDVTGSMLAQESNVKGEIEYALSMADFSPGTDGTRQTHKTLGGMNIIANSMAQRVQTVRRMHLAAYQDQMWFMEKLTSQFLMDKQPFTVYGPDGSTVIMEFDLWDIDTGGSGFDFVIENDPAFGDDQVRLNQLMATLAGAWSYIAQAKQWRMDIALPDVEEIQRKILQKSGWMDTSRIMKRSDGSVDPDTELKIMMTGQPVSPTPMENFAEHLATHEAQEEELAKLVAAGRVDAKALALLRFHKAATKSMAAKIIANPGPLAQGVKTKKMMDAGAMNGGSPISPGAPIQPPTMGDASTGAMGAAAGGPAGLGLRGPTGG